MSIRLFAEYGLLVICHSVILQQEQAVKHFFLHVKFAAIQLLCCSRQQLRSCHAVGFKRSNRFVHGRRRAHSSSSFNMGWIRAQSGDWIVHTCGTVPKCSSSRLLVSQARPVRLLDCRVGLQVVFVYHSNL